jgi:hypothetical protein
MSAAANFLPEQLQENRRESAEELDRLVALAKDGAKDVRKGLEIPDLDKLLDSAVLDLPKMQTEIELQGLDELQASFEEGFDPSAALDGLDLEGVKDKLAAAFDPEAALLDFDLESKLGDMTNKFGAGLNEQVDTLQPTQELQGKQSRLLSGRGNQNDPYVLLKKQNQLAAEQKAIAERQLFLMEAGTLDNTNKLETEFIA